MSDVMWNVRMESVLSDIGRTLGEFTRETGRFLASLDTTEKLVLLALALIGLFYVVLHHFQRREDESHAGGQFAGMMFVMASLAAGVGWTLSNHTA